MSAPERSRQILVVANETVVSPALIDLIEQKAKEGPVYFLYSRETGARPARERPRCAGDCPERGTGRTPRNTASRDSSCAAPGTSSR